VFDFSDLRVTKFLNSPVKIGLINFYAPWCKGCVKFKDQWIDLAIHYKNKINICAVNCEDPYNNSLRWKFDITSYPNIMFFDENGYLEHYDGSINTDLIQQFISSKL
jgi:thioredoxin-like negative regulator of GroEL